MFKTFKHLFTRSQAWRLVASPINEYIKGFSSFPVDIRDFIDRIWLDIFPTTTRELPNWEQQFNLTPSGTVGQRASNLDGRWKGQGGQGFDYLQDLIHDSGYPQVFLHEWWDDNAGVITAKDPGSYMDRIYQTEFGVVDMDFGSPNAEFGVILFDGAAKMLVNKGSGAVYPVPTNTDQWPYIIYVGAEIIGEIAEVPAELKEEFERLLLQFFPYQQWIALMINYT